VASLAGVPVTTKQRPVSGIAWLSWASDGR
jgi:hypothetical protein